MDLLTKINENKHSNERFLRAFDFLCGLKGVTAGQLAKMIGTNGSLISAYRSGKKKASDDMMDRLLRASQGKIYRRYLTGHSDFMLLANVPDEQFLEDERREENPDYDVMQSRTKKQPEEQLPFWADNLINIMSEQVKQNEELNRELRQSIAEVHALRDELRSMLRSPYAVPAPPIPYLATAEP